MDYDSIIKSFGIPQAVVICVALAVGKWVAGNALTWLGDRLDNLGALLKPHLEDWFQLRRERIRLDLAQLRRSLDLPVGAPAPTANNSAALVGAANREEAPKT